MVFNKYIAISLIFYTTLLFSCGGKTVEEQPENLIQKEIFTEMILELQLIEAHLNEVRVINQSFEIVPTTFFKRSLKNMGHRLKILITL